MSVADWILCGITTVIVLAFGGLPEQVTDALVAKISTHRKLDHGRVVGVDVRGLPLVVESAALVDAFNQALFMGRVARFYLPTTATDITLHLARPKQSIRILPFRQEIGVLSTRGRRQTFYTVRSAALAALLVPSKDVRPDVKSAVPPQSHL